MMVVLATTSAMVAIVCLVAAGARVALRVRMAFAAAAVAPMLALHLSVSAVALEPTSALLSDVETSQPQSVTQPAEMGADAG